MSSIRKGLFSTTLFLLVGVLIIACLCVQGYKEFVYCIHFIAGAYLIASVILGLAQKFSQNKL